MKTKFIKMNFPLYLTLSIILGILGFLATLIVLGELGELLIRFIFGDTFFIQIWGIICLIISLYIYSRFAKYIFKFYLINIFDVSKKGSGKTLKFIVKNHGLEILDCLESDRKIQILNYYNEILEFEQNNLENNDKLKV